MVTQKFYFILPMQSCFCFPQTARQHFSPEAVLKIVKIVKHNETIENKKLYFFPNYYSATKQKVMVTQKLYSILPMHSCFCFPQIARQHFSPEAVLIVDALPHPVGGGAHVAGVSLGVCQQVHITTAGGIIVIQFAETHVLDAVVRRPDLEARTGLLASRGVRG